MRSRRRVLAPCTSRQPDTRYPVIVVAGPALVRPALPPAAGPGGYARPRWPWVMAAAAMLCAVLAVLFAVSVAGTWPPPPGAVQPYPTPAPVSTR